MLSSMKKKFINGMLLVAMFFATMGSFVSCKDCDEDAYAELQVQIMDQNSTLRELLDQQAKELAKTKQELQEMIKLINSCKCEPWQEEVENLKSELQSLQNDIISLQGEMEALENDFKNNYVSKAEYEEKMKFIQEKINN